MLPSLNKYLWTLLYLSFPFMFPVYIPKSRNSQNNKWMTSSVPLSRYRQPLFIVEILYTRLFWCKGNMASMDALPGLISLLLLFMTIAISGLSSYIDFCVAMCHVKPSLQFIQFLWYSVSSVENFRKIQQTIKIWNFTLIISCHTHDKHILFPKHEHTFLPSIICI